MGYSTNSNICMNVEDLLVDKKIPYYAKGKDYLVQCLNPEHDDNNPSMRIDQITGIFNCFSCGFKGSIYQSTCSKSLTCHAGWVALDCSVKGLHVG